MMPMMFVVPMVNMVAVMSVMPMVMTMMVPRKDVMSMIHMRGGSGVSRIMSVEVVGLMTMVFRMMVVGGGMVMVSVMDVIKVLVDMLVMIMLVMMNIVVGLMIVSMVVMMLAQMQDIVVDVFVLLVRLKTVRGRSRVRDSFVNGVVISMDVIVAKINVVPVMMAMMVSMVVSMVVSMMMMRVVEMVSVMMTMMISMMVAVEMPIVVSMMVSMVVSVMPVMDDVVLLRDFVSVSSDVNSSHGDNFR